MPSPNSRLALHQALALGLMHGPAELLPVSSSGHLTVVPWLLGWDYVELDEDLRKAFEVALHAGTTVALMIALRGELRTSLSTSGLKLAALSAGPPALVGYTLEGPIKHHLGTPATVAAGLIAGAGALALADRRPQARRASEAGSLDALWLGAAQACALVPGISRNGATLAAARLRRFTRGDAARLSRQIALAPIAGATLLQALRMRHRLALAGTPLAAGAAAAFFSTLASQWLIPRSEQDRSLLPVALYRLGLAAEVLRRLRG